MDKRIVLVICEDTSVKEEIKGLLEAGEEEKARETAALAQELGVAVTLVEATDEAEEAEESAAPAKGPSMKTRLRERARKAPKEATRKSVEIPSGFVAALMAHPAAVDAMEKAAMIQAYACRRRALEIPERAKVLLAWMREIKRGRKPLPPAALREVLYGKVDYLPTTAGRYLLGVTS